MKKEGRMQILSQMIDEEFERCRGDIVDEVKFIDAVCGFLSYDTSDDRKRMVEEYVNDFVDRTFGKMKLEFFERYLVGKMVLEKLVLEGVLFWKECIGRKDCEGNWICEGDMLETDKVNK